MKVLIVVAVLITILAKVSARRRHGCSEEVKSQLRDHDEKLSTLISKLSTLENISANTPNVQNLKTKLEGQDQELSTISSKLSILESNCANIQDFTKRLEKLEKNVQVETEIEDEYEYLDDNMDTKKCRYQIRI